MLVAHPAVPGERGPQISFPFDEFAGCGADQRLTRSSTPCRLGREPQYAGQLRPSGLQFLDGKAQPEFVAQRGEQQPGTAVPVVLRRRPEIVKKSWLRLAGHLLAPPLVQELPHRIRLMQPTPR